MAKLLYSRTLDCLFCSGCQCTQEPLNKHVLERGVNGGKVWRSIPISHPSKAIHPVPRLRESFTQRLDVEWKKCQQALLMVLGQEHWE